MKFLPIAILIVVCFVGRGESLRRAFRRSLRRSHSRSDGLMQCYTCNDCNELDDSMLEFCPTYLVATTSAPSTTAASSEETEESSSSAETDESSSSEGTDSKAAGTKGISKRSLNDVTTAPLSLHPTAITTVLPTLLRTTLANNFQTPDLTQVSSQVMFYSSTEPSGVLSTTGLESINSSMAKSISLKYYCYTIEIKGKDGNGFKIKKGCAETPENKTACEVLKDEYGATEDDCKFCSEDKCNGSGILEASRNSFVFAFLATFFIMKIKEYLK